MTTKLQLLTSLCLTVTLGALTGCPRDPDPGESDGNTTGTTSDGSTSAMMTTMSMTTMQSTATSTGGGDSSTGMPTTGESMTGGMSTGMVECVAEVENGGTCTDNCECVSNECSIPLPIADGLCGECNEDADCDLGCNLPNPLNGMPSVCGDGLLGAGCETADACVDLVCALIIDVPGFISASTCSECEDDAGCMDGNLCAPTYDVANITGNKTCIAPGSLENGSGCDLEGSGNEQCTSTFCAEAVFMNLLTLGVCSECLVDADCGGGMTCVAPEIDLMMGLVPGVCM